jgi:hypothetical protein
MRRRHRFRWRQRRPVRGRSGRGRGWWWQRRQPTTSGPPKTSAAKRIGPTLSLPRTVSPTASGVGTTPGPVLALAVLTALALLAAVLTLVARLLGWGTGWTSPGRHALREAGMRVGTAVTGIADWARARRASGT